jgi:hypothetical protein
MPVGLDNSRRHVIEEGVENFETRPPDLLGASTGERRAEFVVQGLLDQVL